MEIIESVEKLVTTLESSAEAALVSAESSVEAVAASAEASVEAAAASVEASVEAAAEAPKSWVATAFGKFGEIPTWGWAVLLALLLVGVICWTAVRKKNGRSVWGTHMIAMGAICMALTTVLSLIRLMRMPMGGSITPAAMLPLLLFAAAYGIGPGVTLGALYGILDYVLGGGSFVNLDVLAWLLDYPLGYAALGLCGVIAGRLIANPKKATMILVIGIVIGCAARFLCSFLSGWIFYGMYAPDYGFSSPVLYSICYNGAYMLPNCVICAILGGAVGPRLVREMRKVKVQ